MVRSTAFLCVAVLVQACTDPCPTRRREGCREVIADTVIPIVAGKIITVTVIPVRRTVCDVDICVSPTKR
jgi:hypothetical protein